MYIKYFSSWLNDIESVECSILMTMEMACNMKHINASWQHFGDTFYEMRDHSVIRVSLCMFGRLVFGDRFPLNHANMETSQASWASPSVINSLIMQGDKIGRFSSTIPLNCTHHRPECGFADPNLLETSLFIDRIEAAIGAWPTIADTSRISVIYITD